MGRIWSYFLLTSSKRNGVLVIDLTNDDTNDDSDYNYIYNDNCNDNDNIKPPRTATTPAAAAPTDAQVGAANTPAIVAPPATAAVSAAAASSTTATQVGAANTPAIVPPASNDRTTAAETIKQGFKRAPDDVLKGRKIYKINRTAFQSKTPAADSVTGTSVAATTNGTTATSSDTTDEKNEGPLVHTRTRVETWVPTVSRKVFSDAFIAVLVLQLVASVVVFGIFALGFFFVGLLQIL